MVAQPDSAKTGATAPSGVLLQSIAELAGEMMMPLLDSMFAACDGMLFELARAAAGTQQEQRLLDFRNELQRKREAIAAQFLQQLMAGFAGFERPRTDPRTVGIDELALVPSEQVERELFVAGGVARVRSEAQALLAQLHARMCSLAPAAVQANETDNPLDPGNIAQVFLDACQKIESDMQCIRLLCREFDAHVLGRLDDFYERSNKVLIDARVLPLAGFGQGRTGGATRAAGVSEPGRQADPVSDEVPGVAGQAGAEAASAFGELSALLARVRRTGTARAFASLPSAGMACTSGASRVGAAELVSLLSDLPSSGSIAGRAHGSPFDIRSALDAIATRHGALPAAGTESDVVDLVTLIFDTVADDRNLPLAIQVLLSRLQLPVLKLALVDRHFFTDRRHPARQLVNAIARAGRGWDGHDQESQDALLEQMRTIVDGLAVDARPGSDAFADALQRLQECVERAEQRATKIERRTSEKAVADARLAAARDAVHAVMQQELDDHDVPVAVLEFFNIDWARVLQLRHLRKGPDSPEWRDAVDMLEALPRSLAPVADATARDALERGLPALYQRLDAALEDTQGNTVESRARLDTIRELHRCLLEPPASGSAQVIPIERARIQPPAPIPPRNRDVPTPAPTAVEQQAPPHEVLSLESLQRTDTIAIGTWFEFSDRNGTKRRCKLSARIEETRMLLFCDRSGRLACEQSRKGFAYALQTGEWRIIEDEPLLDRTLGQITGNLRREAGGSVHAAR